MDDSVEASGRTVDEAVEQALHQLGLRRDDVEVEVVHEARRARFGLRQELARVIVRPRGSVSPGRPPSASDEAEVEAEEDLEEEAVPAGASRASSRQALGTQRPRRNRSRRASSPSAEPLPWDDEAVERAEGVLRELLRLMDVPAVVTRRPPKSGGDGLGQASAVLDITGDDLGVLIGRRGETLASLQYMVNLLANQGMDRPFSVTIDVEGYRQRRERSLTVLARRAADRAHASGASVTLEPMSANERRLVHLALADDDRVVTSSVGGGEARKVVVSPRR